MSEPKISEEQGTQYNDIPAHFGILNISCLETRTEYIAEVARDASVAIGSLKAKRQADRAIRWSNQISEIVQADSSPSQSQRAKETPADGVTGGWPYYYQPKTYALTGTFDIATIFLSPTLEMDSWAHVDPLRRAGHDLNMCFLPNFQELFKRSASPTETSQARAFYENHLLKRLKDLKRRKRLNRTYRINTPIDDFNLEFFRSYKNVAPTAQRPLDEEFVAIIKLKLNPALWPKPADRVDQETGHLVEHLGLTWLAVHRWREETSVRAEEGGEEREKRPKVALGITLGWNELVCIAHADSPGKLLALTLRLRSLGTEAPSDLLNGEDAHQKPEHHWAHLFLTTISVIGYDWHIVKQARRMYQREISNIRVENDREIFPQTTDHPPEMVSPETLWNVVARFHAQSPYTVKPCTRGDIGPLLMRLGCYTYPGHEGPLIQMFLELEAFLSTKLHVSSPSGTQDPKSETSILDVGKRDIWAPNLRFGNHTCLPPRQAMFLRELISEWSLYGGYPKQRSGVPHVFDFYTLISCPVSSVEQNDSIMEQQKDCQSTGRHVRKDTQRAHLPFHSFMKKPLRVVLEGALFSEQRKEDLEEENALLLEHHSLKLARLRQAMRTLQIPYYQAEQIDNLFAAVFWSHDRDVIWNESLELIPVVMAVYQDILAQEAWWNHGQCSAPLDPWDFVTEAERKRKIISTIERQLRTYRNTDIDDLLKHFRSYFYSRHLSNYLTDEMPDMNLRYRGSVHKLLSIAGLILDTMADQALGSRACMAVIGDVASPQVSSPCNILTVDLSTDTFRLPFMLESIAHEVGHKLILELIRDSVDDSWRKHNPWVSSEAFDPKIKEAKARTFRKLQNAIYTFNHDVMDERLSKNPNLFVEATSDFIETLLLGIPVAADSDDEFYHWISSFTLRLTMAVPIERYPRNLENQRVPRNGASDAKAQDVPMKQVDIFMFGFLRIITVAISRKLAAYGQSEGKPPKLLLEQFRADFIAETLEPRNLAEQFGSKGLFGAWDNDQITRHLSSEERWTKFIQDRIFRESPWFASQTNFQIFCETIFSTSAHFDHGRPESYQEMKGPGRFLTALQAAFRELRHELVNIVYPSLFVRHWMNQDDMEKVRKSDGGTAFSDETRPWRAFLDFNAKQKYYDDGQPIDIKVVIFQRGNLIFRHDRDLTTWFKSTSRFLVRLQQMIPAWRRSILEKSARVVETYPKVEPGPDSEPQP